MFVVWKLRWRVEVFDVEIFVTCYDIVKVVSGDKHSGKKGGAAQVNQ